MTIQRNCGFTYSRILCNRQFKCQQYCYKSLQINYLVVLVNFSQLTNLFVSTYKTVLYKETKIPRTNTNIRLSN